MPDILLTHLRELIALERRMDDTPGRERIRARIEETRDALKGMPTGTITPGELHTALRCVLDNMPVQAKRVGSAIQSSDTRAANALKKLEAAGLVTTDARGEWTTNLTPDEANAAFDKAFPGLSTIDKSTKQPTTKAAKPKPTQQGGSTMATKANIEYTKDTSKQDTTKFNQVVKMIDLLRKSPDPVGFTDLCDKVGAKYPQDIQAAMFALDATGIIERYTYVEEGSTRTRTAYKWAQEEGDTPRPTPSTGTASRRRSSRPKKETAAASK